eukprot:771179_1
MPNKREKSDGRTPDNLIAIVWVVVLMCMLLIIAFYPFMGESNESKTIAKIKDKLQFSVERQKRILSENTYKKNATTKPSHVLPKPKPSKTILSFMAYSPTRSSVSPQSKSISPPRMLPKSLYHKPAASTRIDNSFQHSVSPNQHSVSLYNQRVVSPYNQHAVSPYHHAVLPNQHAMSPYHHVVSPNQHEMSPYQHAVSPYNQHAVSPYHHAVLPNQHAVSPYHHVVSPNQHEMSPYQHAVSPYNQHYVSPYQNSASPYSTSSTPRRNQSMSSVHPPGISLNSPQESSASRTNQEVMVHSLRLKRSSSGDSGYRPDSGSASYSDGS